jgi:hypothetical protein
VSTTTTRAPDGSDTYAATATDAAGNESVASGARVVVVDTVAPASPVVGGKDLVQNTRAVSLSGTAEPGATIRLSGGTEVVAAGNGTWSAVLVDVPDGRHVYTATASDAAGNESVASAERVIVVDTVPPTTTVNADGSATSEPGATLECRVDGGAWASCAASHGGGAPGEHVLEARATDPAGNVGPIAQYAWTVAPPVTFADPPVTPVRPFSPPAIVVVPQKLTMTVARQSLATVLKRGLAVRVGSKCSVVLSQGKKVLARASGTGTLRLKLSAPMRRTLARSKRVRLTLTVTAPGAATVKRAVTLKR